MFQFSYDLPQNMPHVMSKVSSTCEVLLYRRDLCKRNSILSSQPFYFHRDGAWSHRYTAIRIDEIVCKHFRITKEWDKKLVKSVLFDGVHRHWFELGRTAEPNVVLGIRMRGDRRVLFEDMLPQLCEERFSPLKKEGKISHTRMEIDQSIGAAIGTLDSTREVIDYETLKYRSPKWQLYFLMIGLFNSESFQSVVACRTVPFELRRLEKLA